MNHEIYVFGSIVRGDVSYTSDADVLVIPLGEQRRESYPENWSVYSPYIIDSYYQQGRLFAWHLHYEARCVYCPTENGMLTRLGPPSPYLTARYDVEELTSLLDDAVSEVRNGTRNMIFELGLIYTAVRDIAMSASWSMLGRPEFARDCPFLLPIRVPLSRTTYEAMMLARHRSTRGIEACIDVEAVAADVHNAPLREWADSVARNL